MNRQHQIFPENRSRVGVVADFLLNIIAHPHTTDIIRGETDEPEVRVINIYLDTVDIFDTSGRTGFACGGDAGFIFHVGTRTGTLCDNRLQQTIQYGRCLFRHLSNLCGILLQNDVALGIGNVCISIRLYILTAGDKNLIATGQLLQGHTGGHAAERHRRKAGRIQLVQGADLEFVFQSIVAHLRGQNIDNLRRHSVDRLLHCILNGHRRFGVGIGVVLRPLEGLSVLGQGQRLINKGGRPGNQIPLKGV